MRIKSRRDVVGLVWKAFWQDWAKGLVTSVLLALPDVFLLRQTYMGETWKWVLGYMVMGYGTFAIAYDLYSTRFVQKLLGRHIDPALELAELYGDSNNLLAWISSMYPAEEEGDDDFASEIKDYFDQYMEWSQKVFDKLKRLEPTVASLWVHSLPDFTDGDTGIVAAHKRRLVLRREELRKYLESYERNK